MKISNGSEYWRQEWRLRKTWSHDGKGAGINIHTTTEYGVQLLLKTVPWTTMLGIQVHIRHFHRCKYKYTGWHARPGRSQWDHSHYLSLLLSKLNQSFTAWLPYVLGPRDHGPSVSSWAGFYPRIERLPLHFHASAYLCDTVSGRRILWPGVSAIAEVVQPWPWKGVSAIRNQRLNDDQSMVWPYSVCSVTFNH